MQYIFWECCKLDADSINLSNESWWQTLKMSPLPVQRNLYADVHDAYRQRVQSFLAFEIAPFLERWEQEGRVSKSAWRAAGDAGLLCSTVPKVFGGPGLDYRYNAIFREELARIGVSGTGLGMGLHSDVIANMLLDFGTDGQKRRWLGPMASGACITALAMTEPHAGSDVKAIRTTAVRRDDSYVINGCKRFITNGGIADLVIVAVKTAPDLGARGMSLLLVEGDRPGFERVPRERMLGLGLEDVATLEFRDVTVPVENLVGAENSGFACLMQAMVWERLQLSVASVAAAEACMDWTIKHVKTRFAFGQPLIDQQNTRFVLAECATEIQLGRLFVDRCVELACDRRLDPTTVAMSKYWCTELLGRVTDRCLQLHGGSGIMWSHPIARVYADARVQRIWGGANEIMKEVIAKSLIGRSC